MSWKLTEAGKKALRDIKKGKLKVSWPQERSLEDVQRHGDPWMRVFGGAAHGGMSSVMRVLHLKKNWIVRMP